MLSARCVIRHVRRFAIQLNFQGEITFIAKWNYGATRLLPQIEYYHELPIFLTTITKKSNFENHILVIVCIKNFFNKIASVHLNNWFLFFPLIFKAHLLTLPRPMTNKWSIYVCKLFFIIVTNSKDLKCILLHLKSLENSWCHSLGFEINEFIRLDNQQNIFYTEWTTCLSQTALWEIILLVKMQLKLI